MKKSAIYAVIICALIAGTNGIFIKQISSLTTGSIAWFRTVIPIVFMGSIIIKKPKFIFLGNYKKMLLASCINAARIYLFIVAYIYTSLGNAVVLFYSWPIFVAILEFFYLKKRFSKRQFYLLFIAFSGLIICYSDKPFSFDNNDFIGMMAALLAALGYALTVIIFKSESKNYNKDQTIIFQNIVSALIFTPFLFSIKTIDFSHIGIAILYGSVIGVVVYRLFFYGLKHLKAITASSLMYIEVISAILLGYFILNETLTISAIIGGILIIGSSYFIAKMNL